MATTGQVLPATRQKQHNGRELAACLAVNRFFARSTDPLPGPPATVFGLLSYSFLGQRWAHHSTGSGLVFLVPVKGVRFTDCTAACNGNAHLGCRHVRFAATDAKTLEDLKMAAVAKELLRREKQTQTETDQEKEQEVFLFAQMWICVVPAEWAPDPHPIHTLHYLAGAACHPGWTAGRTGSLAPAASLVSCHRVCAGERGAASCAAAAVGGGARATRGERGRCAAQNGARRGDDLAGDDD